MDIMKLAGGIVGGVLVKDYAVYKKRINQWYNKNIYGPLRGNKIHTTPNADPSLATTTIYLFFQSLKYR